MAVRTCCSLRLALFAALLSIGVPPSAEAGSISVSSFTNTSGGIAIAPAVATFELGLAFAPSGAVVSGELRSATIDFSSGEGEVSSVNWLGSAASTSLNSTFTFQNPGTYTVTANGIATALETHAELIPVFQTVFVPVHDGNGNFIRYDSVVVQSGYQTRYVTQIQSYFISAQLLYGVGEIVQLPIGFIPFTITAGPTTSVPESGSLAWLLSGILALGGASRWGREGP